jgi:hypothetical protein
MADDVWGRPRIPTGESVAAALRLAKELKPDASLLCEGADGTTELLVRKDGYVERYNAYDSGATERLERRARSRRYRAGNKLMHAGFAAIPAILVAGFAFKPENSSLWMGVPLFLAWGLAIGGGLLRGQLDAIEAPDGAVSAQIPYDIDGWDPRTVAQLAAIEQLSKDSDSGARVRNIADGGVEVETFRKRERRLHVLDAHGTIVEQRASLVGGGIYWTEKFAAVALIIPFAAMWLFDGARFFFAGLAVSMIIGVLAWRVDRRKHLVRVGEKWFDIQIEPPSD